VTAKAEATNAPLDFTFENTKYQILPTNEWPFEALEAMEDGKVLTILRHVLVGDGYKTFAATKPNVGRVTAFYEDAQKVLGIAGN
jgi:hypothetical protein